jgi:hypothetical protein
MALVSPPPGDVIRDVIGVRRHARVFAVSFASGTRPPGGDTMIKRGRWPMPP